MRSRHNVDVCLSFRPLNTHRRGAVQIFLCHDVFISCCIACNLQQGLRWCWDFNKKIAVDLKGILLPTFKELRYAHGAALFLLLMHVELLSDVKLRMCGNKLLVEAVINMSRTTWFYVIDTRCRLKCYWDRYVWYDGIQVLLFEFTARVVFTRV
jgi:hypothetical protein